MEDITSNVTGWIEMMIGAGSAVLAWFSTKFQWWKNIKSKGVRVAVAVGLFLAIAITLSLITSLFS